MCQVSFLVVFLSERYYLICLCVRDVAARDWCSGRENLDLLVETDRDRENEQAAYVGGVGGTFCFFAPGYFVFWLVCNVIQRCGNQIEPCSHRVFQSRLQLERLY